MVASILRSFSALSICIVCLSGCVQQDTVRTEEELAVAWWEWAMSEPAATNPIADDTGADCGRNQPADVWFLAGTFGGPAERSCSVPAGRPIFFPVLNMVCDPADSCDAAMTGAQVSGTFDGANLAVKHIVAEGTVTAREGNAVWDSGGRAVIMSAGWWVRLDPPTAGRHELSFAGTTANGFHLDIQYHLTIS